MQLSKLIPHYGIHEMTRVERGLGLIRHSKILQKGEQNIVEVRNGRTGHSATVILSKGLKRGYCSCKDFRKHGKVCKHIVAAAEFLKYVCAIDEQTDEIMTRRAG